MADTPLSAPAPAPAPQSSAAIGRIDRDTLRYHGENPFSGWGAIWKRVMTDVPAEAAYAMYDHYVRKTGVLPVPPLSFTKWSSKCFRIMKTEDNGALVLALYKHNDQFMLIRASKEAYLRWAEKKYAAVPDTTFPPYTQED